MHNYPVLTGLRQIVIHGSITLLAVLIAFSVPRAAQYILFVWWPRVQMDQSLLLATEIGLASTLVLMFNYARVARANRQNVTMARLAALVYARDARDHWLSRLIERSLRRKMTAARDACILTLTGYNTFVDRASLVREALDTTYEVRVLLAHPEGDGLRRRVESLPEHVTLDALRAEIDASMAFLAQLRRQGKKVSLKFYDEDPLWKVVVLGDHVWVQHCHGGAELSRQPEYVFALQHEDPRIGLFVPFYRYFLAQWNRSHPEYDFDTGELVYRDASGGELRREPLAPVAALKAA